MIAAGIYKAATGIDTSAEEINLAGERVWNLQKAANLREGFERKDDEFPERWVTEPLKTEKGEEVYLHNYTKTKRLNKADADELLDGYYEEREWDVKRGIPTKDKLVKLGLDDVAKDLEKRKLI